MGSRLLVAAAGLSWWLLLNGAETQFVKWRPMDVVARLMVAKIDPVDAYHVLEAVRNRSLEGALKAVRDLRLDVGDLYNVLRDMRIDPLDAFFALQLWVREHSSETDEDTDSSDDSLLAIAEEINSLFKKIVRAYTENAMTEVIKEAKDLAKLINDPKKLFKDFFGYDKLFQSFKRLHPAAFETVKNILFGKSLPPTQAPAAIGQQPQQAVPHQQPQPQPALPQQQQPQSQQAPPQQSQPQPQQQQAQPQQAQQQQAQPQQAQQQQAQPQQAQQQQAQPQPAQQQQAQQQQARQQQAQPQQAQQQQVQQQAQPQPQTQQQLPAQQPSQPLRPGIPPSIQQIHAQLHGNDVDLQDTQFADTNRYTCIHDETQVYNKGPHDPPSMARRTLHNIRRFYDKLNKTVIESLKTIEYYDSGLKNVRKNVRTLESKANAKKK